MDVPQETTVDTQCRHVTEHPPQETSTIATHTESGSGVGVGVGVGWGWVEGEIRRQESRGRRDARSINEYKPVKQLIRNYLH